MPSSLALRTIGLFFLQSYLTPLRIGQNKAWWNDLASLGKDMMTKNRTIIFPCFIILLGICGMFVNVSIWSGERICGYCGSREKLSEVSYFVLGAHWSRVTTGTLTPSLFLVDFPEHHCEHAWAQFDGKWKAIWDSPLLRRSEQRSGIDMNRSAIVQRYGEDVSFRENLKSILASGTLSRKRLLELATFRCMDGGTCHMNSDDPGDSALLDLIRNSQDERPR